MKHFLHLLFLLPVFSYAQNDSIIEYSRLVKFMMQPNVVVKLNYKTIGSTSDLNIGVATASSLKDNSQERSVYFTNNTPFHNFVPFNERSIQISVDDLSAFVNALELMKRELDQNNVREQETYRYVSSNFTVLEMKNRHMNTKRWDIILFARCKYINAPAPGMSLSINQRNIDDMLTILQKLKSDLGNDLYKKQ